MDILHVLMISWAGQHGNGIQPRTSELAIELLLIIAIAAFEPVAQLGIAVQVGQTRSHTVIVGMRQATVDIPQQQDVQRIGQQGVLPVVGLTRETRHRVIAEAMEAVTAYRVVPLGFGRHTEPRLPAYGAHQGAARKQDEDE